MMKWRKPTAATGERTTTGVWTRGNSRQLSSTLVNSVTITNISEEVTDLDYSFKRHSALIDIAVVSFL